MSEDSNEKTGCSGVETLEPRERAEAPDNRIAPSAPRGEEGASVGGASATAASAPSSRRPRKALLATGVVAAAVALCAVVASMGFATGWLGDPAPSDPVPMPSVVTDAPSRRRTTRPIARMPPKRLRRALTGKRVPPSMARTRRMPTARSLRRPARRHRALSFPRRRALLHRLRRLRPSRPRRHRPPAPSRCRCTSTAPAPRPMATPHPWAAARSPSTRAHPSTMPSALPERRWAGRAATSAPSAALRNSLAVPAAAGCISSTDRRPDTGAVRIS